MTFTYDYMGRLVKKDNGYGDVDVYLYDGWNRIATFDVQSSMFDVQCFYLWGTDLSGTLQGAGGVGGLLKEGDWYPTYDANGNIMQKLDGTGAMVMNVDYDPFGRTLGHSGSISPVGEYGFSTKPYVTELHCYYYGYRYYDPLSGRWLSRDPILEFSFQYLEGYYPESLAQNTYAFVDNNPVNWIDMLGLSSNCCGGQSLKSGYECCSGTQKSKSAIKRCKSRCLDQWFKCHSFSNTAAALGIPGFGAAGAQGYNKTGKKPRHGVAGGGPSGPYSSRSRQFGKSIGGKTGGNIGKAIGRASIKRAGVIGAGAGAWGLIGKCGLQLASCRSNCCP